NVLSRFRSLISNRKLPDGSYEPAIYPETYFDSDWTMVENEPITDKIEKSKGAIDFKTNGLRFLAAAKKASFNDLVKVLEGGESVATVASVDRMLTIKKINFKSPEGTLVTSLDVMVNEGNREVRARVPIEQPLPYDPILEIRKGSSGQWLRDFPNI